MKLPDSAVFLRRVVLKNYRSIAGCDTRLGPLVFLVGPNGAGKSNFLDALEFVADSLRFSLDHALRDRGGIHEVRRRSRGHPTHFGIRVDFSLVDGLEGHYGFRVGAKSSGSYEVQQEECVVRQAMLRPEAYFRVRSGGVESSLTVVPPASPDRLYLVNAAGLPEFRTVYDGLSQMGFYNLNPDRIRELQPPDPGDLLTRDGSNLASVLGQIAARAKTAKLRIEEYLAQVVPGVTGVETKVVGPMETLEFRQMVAGAPDPWRFFAASMSDGTLRALGILVALFQPGRANGARVPLVGIEEPETALHPAAAGVLRDSLNDASRSIQVLVTSHSPDLLDDSDIDVDAIRAVVSEGGATQIARVDEAGRSAVRDRLYTPGELLRLNQLSPDRIEAEQSIDAQLGLFGDR